ncbi:LapA family protein [Blastococcus sp. CT_GayMR19]|nr:LapA family protein [Blastococcus sp. CT_GayMR19]
MSKAPGGPAPGGPPTAPASRRAPDSSTPAPTRGGPATPHRAGGAGLTLAAALLVFVTVILVLFVIFNTQTVDISLVFANVQAPLVLALVIAAALGGLVVGLAGVALRARRTKR